MNEGIAPGTERADTAPAWTGATTTATRLLLLRHGQSPMSVRREYSGSASDPALTEIGQQQAQRAAAHLARLQETGVWDISAIIASPQLRTQQTAAAVAEALGLPIDSDPRLRETDFGRWEGKTFSEAAAADAQLHNQWLSDPSVAPPGGESFHQVDERVAAARRYIEAQFAEQTVVVVSHVTPIKALLRQALAGNFELFTRLHLDLASLSVVEFYADGPTSVRLVNDTSYL